MENKIKWEAPSSKYNLDSRSFDLLGILPPPDKVNPTQIIGKRIILDDRDSTILDCALEEIGYAIGFQTIMLPNNTEVFVLDKRNKHAAVEYLPEFIDFLETYGASKMLIEWLKTYYE